MTHPIPGYRLKPPPKQRQLHEIGGRYNRIVAQGLSSLMDLPIWKGKPRRSCDRLRHSD